MTSVMLVVGFLVVVSSGFATLQEFGYLTALTMAICLATDLVLLPALLVRVPRLVVLLAFVEQRHAESSRMKLRVGIDLFYDQG